MEIAPIAVCRFLRHAHTGQDILLYHDPAVIAPLFQSGLDRGKIHLALSQFTEDAFADGLEVVPALRARTLSDLRLAVLEVNMPDTVRVAAQPLYRVAAAKTIVTGIEA